MSALRATSKNPRTMGTRTTTSSSNTNRTQPNKGKTPETSQEAKPTTNTNILPTEEEGVKELIFDHQQPMETGNENENNSGTSTPTGFVKPFQTPAVLKHQQNETSKTETLRKERQPFGPPVNWETRYSRRRYPMAVELKNISGNSNEQKARNLKKALAKFVSALAVRTAQKTAKNSL